MAGLVLGLAWPLFPRINLDFQSCPWLQTEPMDNLFLGRRQGSRHLSLLSVLRLLQARWFRVWKTSFSQNKQLLSGGAIDPRVFYWLRLLECSSWMTSGSTQEGISLCGRTAVSLALCWWFTGTSLVLTRTWFAGQRFLQVKKLCIREFKSKSTKLSQLSNKYLLSEESIVNKTNSSCPHGT